MFREQLPDGLPPARSILHSIELCYDAESLYRKFQPYFPRRAPRSQAVCGQNSQVGQDTTQLLPMRRPTFFEKERDCTQVPRSDEMFDRFGKAKCFTEVYQTTGFHQIIIVP